MSKKIVPVSSWMPWNLQSQTEWSFRSRHCLQHLKAPWKNKRHRNLILLPPKKLVGPVRISSKFQFFLYDTICWQLSSCCSSHRVSMPVRYLAALAFMFQTVACRLGPVFMLLALLMLWSLPAWCFGLLPFWPLTDCLDIFAHRVPCILVVYEY
jgi:hypothetical protein